MEGYFVTDMPDTTSPDGSVQTSPFPTRLAHLPPPQPTIDLSAAHHTQHERVVHQLPSLAERFKCAKQCLLAVIVHLGITPAAVSGT